MEDADEKGVSNMRERLGKRITRGWLFV